jgi:hypothetical protein
MTIAELFHYLDSLTAGWLPKEGQELLDAGGWWLVVAIVVLTILLLLGHTLRFLWRALFRRRRLTDWDGMLAISLDECPLPVRPPGEHQLLVYHLPARLRLVVVAPLGTAFEVDPLAVEALLDAVLPGLGAIARNDRPAIRVWQGQLSEEGFVNTFHRRTHHPDLEEQPSRWALLAGRAQVGRQPVMLGLGLWADEPHQLGRLNVEPHQWLDLLRLRPEEVRLS